MIIAGTYSGSIGSTGLSAGSFTSDVANAEGEIPEEVDFRATFLPPRSTSDFGRVEAAALCQQLELCLQTLPPFPRRIFVNIFDRNQDGAQYL